VIPVSVVIITKDEERHIADALESLKDFGDIVVVDSFSCDRTIEIARKFTDRVFQHPWEGYARQKQRAVNYAENPWVLILDADERMTPELKYEISGQIVKTSCSGFYIPRKNFFLGKWIRHGGWWPDYTLRLFRKDLSHVEEREVHEKVIVDGKVGYLSAPIEHYTYGSISEYIKKMDNYSTLAAREMARRKKAPILNAIVNPPLLFVKMFLFRQGFRDGFHGFLLAILYSFYTFLKYAKLWEMKIRKL